VGSGERKGGRAELHDYCMTAFLAICISSLEHPCTIDETHSPRATRGSRASRLSGETDSYDREFQLATEKKKNAPPVRISQVLPSSCPHVHVVVRGYLT
jgi:hypothetical protein